MDNPFVQPTNDEIVYDLCSTAEETLDTIQWDPDGRTQEFLSGVPAPDNTPFVVIINES